MTIAAAITMALHSAPSPSEGPVRATAAAPADATTNIHRLTTAASRGDQAGFAELYERWFDRAAALAARLTGRDESFCLDVVQDAMIRAARGLRPMATAEDLDRWMARVVHTAALDRLRKEGRRARRERRAVAGAETTGRDSVDAALEAEQADQVAWLRAEIRRLDAAEREVLEARIGRGRTLEQIAAETDGTSGAAVHGRLRRLLARLREKSDGGAR